MYYLLIKQGGVANVPNVLSPVQPYECRHTLAYKSVKRCLGPTLPTATVPDHDFKEISLNMKLGRAVAYEI